MSVVDHDFFLEFPDRALNARIDELRATLDRLSHGGDESVDEVVVTVTPGPDSALAIASTRGPDVHSEPAIEAPRRRRDATVAEQVLSWAIGSFKRCRYCGALGGRLEQDTRGRRAWRCRRCRHRSGTSNQSRSARPGLVQMPQDIAPNGF